MIDSRKKFESLPEIRDRLLWVWWNDETGRYCDTGKHPSANATFLNGAWWAYQEQQSKLDDILNLIYKHQYSSGERILKEVKGLYD